jgi:uncharacterized cofD-like protein
LGPGSLYTSIIPNLLTQGIADAIRQSPSRKIYVCNVMTQPGETTGYSVADHVDAVLSHASCPRSAASQLIEAVLVNTEVPSEDPKTGCAPVVFDPERLRDLGIRPVRRPLMDPEMSWHHDTARLAKALMFWYYRHKNRKVPKPPTEITRKERVASFF